MFQVILHTPRIPPNTGNVIRLCANTGCSLHLVRPLFSLDDARMRRAGLDYRERVSVRVHDSLEQAVDAAGGGEPYAFSTRGTVPCHTVRHRRGDILLFGNEETGLPGDVMGSVDPGRRLRIPMAPGNRSINLSNSVAVAVYLALRGAGELDRLGGAGRPGGG